MREPTGPCSRRAAAGCHVKDSAHARSLRAQAVFQGGPLGGEGQELSFNSDPYWVPPASLRSLWEMLPHSVGGLQGTGPVGRRGLRLPVGALGSAPDGSPARTPPPAVVTRPTACSPPALRGPLAPVPSGTVGNGRSTSGGDAVFGTVVIRPGRPFW